MEPAVHYDTLDPVEQAERNDEEDAADEEPDPKGLSAGRDCFGHVVSEYGVLKEWIVMSLAGYPMWFLSEIKPGTNPSGSQSSDCSSPKRLFGRKAVKCSPEEVWLAISSSTAWDKAK